MRSHRLESGKLLLTESETPTPGPAQILVRMRAATISRRDLLIRSGRYPLPATPGVVPLSDGAGEVVAAGAAVTRFRVGDRVTGSYWPHWHDGPLTAAKTGQLGCTEDGMLAEYVLLDQGSAVAVPEHLTWSEAASFTCGGVTAWRSVTCAGLLPGQTALALGSGDVSLFAIQIAKLTGLRAIVTSANPGKTERLLALGADHVVDYAKEADWAARVRELTGGAGADLVIETQGPATIEQSLAAVAFDGELVLLRVTGDEPEPMIINEGVYSGLASIRREFVGSRSDLEAMLRAYGYHGLRPVVDREFAFEEAEEAYGYFAANTAFGKVAVRFGD